MMQPLATTVCVGVGVGVGVCVGDDGMEWDGKKNHFFYFVFLLLTKWDSTGRRLYCKDRTGYEFWCCVFLLPKTPLNLNN